MLSLIRSVCRPWTTVAALGCALAGACDWQTTPIEEQEEPERPPENMLAVEYDEAVSERFLAQCECELESAPERDLGTCIDELHAAAYLPLADRLCVQQGLYRHPDAMPGLECAAQAQRDYTECIAREGCRAPFFCDDGKQLPHEWVCDRVPDCDNEEDETADCPAVFECETGAWVSQNAVCNAVEDCFDGSDEPEGCTPDCATGHALAIAACPPPPNSFLDYVVMGCDTEFEPCSAPGPQGC